MKPSHLGIEIRGRSFCQMTSVKIPSITGLVVIKVWYKYYGWYIKARRRRVATNPFDCPSFISLFLLFSTPNSLQILSQYHTQVAKPTKCVTPPANFLALPNALASSSTILKVCYSQFSTHSNLITSNCSPHLCTNVYSYLSVPHRPPVFFWLLLESHFPSCWYNCREISIIRKYLVSRDT